MLNLLLARFQHGLCIHPPSGSIPHLPQIGHFFTYKVSVMIALPYGFLKLRYVVQLERSYELGACKGYILQREGQCYTGTGGKESKLDLL